MTPPESALPAKQHRIISSQTKFLGVTPPVSVAAPEPRDLKLSQELVETLKEMGQYESETESEERKRVLGELYLIVKEFVKQVGVNGGLSEDLAEEAGGTIFTFGSYRMGVHGSGADIDTLCVCPKHVTREDFFGTLLLMLQEHKEITNVAAVPDAYVPVIKLSFAEIPMDVLFARLNLPQVFENLSLSDNNLLRNLDERDIRSLNGSRVTDAILSLVPDVDEFRKALRCIKLWAKTKTIYSNVMGYLGGVAWAMLVARVCQLYPNASASTIVFKFFIIMDKWQWPQPVLLKPMEEGAPNIRIWNPKVYPTDKQHRMPIITPSYPSMCSTHNVTISTQKIMQQQFKEGARITNEINLGNLNWGDLFVKSNFFQRYKNYLQIVAGSSTKDVQLKWAGLVESKIRQLVMKLEVIEGIEIADPYMKGIERNYNCSLDQKTLIFQGMFPLESEGEERAFTTTFYIGLLIKLSQEQKQKKQLDISWPSREFGELVRGWEGYVAEMSISIQNLKRSQLQDTQSQGTKRPFSE